MCYSINIVLEEIMIPDGPAGNREICRFDVLILAAEEEPVRLNPIAELDVRGNQGVGEILPVQKTSTLLMHDVECRGNRIVGRKIMPYLCISIEPLPVIVLSVPLIRCSGCGEEKSGVIDLPPVCKCFTVKEPGPGSPVPFGMRRSVI